MYIRINVLMVSTNIFCMIQWHKPSKCDLHCDSLQHVQVYTASKVIVTTNEPFIGFVNCKNNYSLMPSNNNSGYQLLP